MWDDFTSTTQPRKDEEKWRMLHCDAGWWKEQRIFFEGTQLPTWEDLTRLNGGWLQHSMQFADKVLQRLNTCFICDIRSVNGPSAACQRNKKVMLIKSQQCDGVRCFSFKRADTGYEDCANQRWDYVMQVVCITGFLFKNSKEC